MKNLAYWTEQILPLAWVYFAFAMSWRTWRVLRRPMKGDLAVPRGDANYGALYALTFAMLPWKKESTRTHWMTYTAGMLMHLGVFSAVLFAVARLVHFGDLFMAPVVLGLGTVGLAMAVGLFIKRMVRSDMRAISSPDDFISNFLVDFYLLGAVLTAYEGGLIGLWRLSVILLLFWIPLGKIYHMVLFFVSRLLFGWQFGRRGVIRHAKPITY